MAGWYAVSELPIRIGLRIHPSRIQFTHLKAVDKSGIEALVLSLSTDAAISLMFSLQNELAERMSVIDVFGELNEDG